MRIKMIVIGMLFMLLSPQAICEVYKWVDDSGQVHFSQQKPANREGSVVNIHKSPQEKSDTSAAVGEVRDISDAKYTDCSAGNDYFMNGGNVVCCNKRCVRERYKNDLPFDCYALECHEAFRAVKGEEYRKEYERDREEWEQKREKAKQRRQEEKRKQAERDQKLVDSCKRRHETYCDEGAEKIRTREKFKAREQQRERMKAKHEFLRY